MPDHLRIALARFNPGMADPAGNAARLRALRAEAAVAGADLLVTPAHSLSGAVPASLAADPSFAAACDLALQDFAAAPGPASILGTILPGPLPQDAALLVEGGAVRARRAAHHPRPGFAAGPVPGPVALGPLRLGLMPGADWRDPAIPETLAETGAELLLALDSLPVEEGGEERALQHALARVVENRLPLILLNRLGAEEESAHDGAALVLNADRSPALRLPPFEEGLAFTEWRRDGASWRCGPGAPPPPPMPPEEHLWRSLLLALRDQRERLRPAPIFVLLTDDPASALTAALAADAFPPPARRAFVLCRFAAPVARRLGLSASPLDLGMAQQELEESLPPAAPHLAARLLRLALDSLAEAGAAFLLVTGPSDHPGAFFPLRHIPPATRRALAAWRNAHCPPGLEGPPGPGLPLPPEHPLPEPDPGTHLTPWQSLWRADYKRRHLPPGLNIAPRAFGHPP